MFKSQLQEYAQKAGWLAPVYYITREGPSHEPKFKATVTVQNESYESPTFYGNLKKAEHAAAEVALMALSAKPDLQTAFPNPLHESGLCKNLLQEYAQKCKLPMPIYTLAKSGETHAPMYTATVEIAGVHYKGGVCKNKKEAEIKAAKTALIAICSDLGGSPAQAFENSLSSVGQPEAPAPTQLSPKPIIKRKKKHRFFKGGFKRGRKMQSRDGQGQESANKDDTQQDTQQSCEVIEPSSDSNLLVASTEIPGITTLAA
eukprot:c10336_g1_i1 orf=172-948(+)